jgi:hypothetical protein
MRNCTFWITTIVRKKRGNRLRMRTRSLPWRHFRSCSWCHFRSGLLPVSPPDAPPKCDFVRSDILLLSVSMVWRQISEAQRWQIIGMHRTGMSFKSIGRQMGYHYTVVNRLVRKHTQTNNVKDLPRSGGPRVTSVRDERALQRLGRRMPFATSPVLKQHWLSNRRLSTRS